MIECTRRIEWDAMHRIPGHESRCRAFHGHRYVAEFTFVAPELDELGMVVDFGLLKDRIGGWVDEKWDHTAILMRGDPDPAVPLLVRSNARLGRPVYWMDGPPTAENMVAELAHISKSLLADTGISLKRIRLWETPNGSATWNED